MAKIRWTPGRLSSHPGPQGEYSVVRWTAPRSDRYAIEAVFLAIDEETTTDVHVLRGGRPLFKGLINLDGQGSQATYKQELALEKGDVLDFVVGRGDILSLVVGPRGSHVCDSTAIELLIAERGGRGRVWDLAKDVVDTMHAGNPHADSMGHADIWSFYTVEVRSPALHRPPFDLSSQAPSAREFVEELAGKGLSTSTATARAAVTVHFRLVLPWWQVVG